MGQGRPMPAPVSRLGFTFPPFRTFLRQVRLRLVVNRPHRLPYDLQLTQNGPCCRQPIEGNYGSTKDLGCKENGLDGKRFGSERVAILSVREKEKQNPNKSQIAV